MTRRRLPHPGGWSFLRAVILRRRRPSHHGEGGGRSAKRRQPATTIAARLEGADLAAKTTRMYNNGARTSSGILRSSCEGGQKPGARRSNADERKGPADDRLRSRPSFLKLAARSRADNGAQTEPAQAPGCGGDNRPGSQRAKRLSPAQSAGSGQDKRLHPHLRHHTARSQSALFAADDRDPGGRRIPLDHINVLVATGLHRPNLGEGSPSLSATNGFSPM